MLALGLELGGPEGLAKRMLDPYLKLAQGYP